MAGEIYLGNPLLKAANVAMEYDEETLQQYLKCKDDPTYFCNEFVKIVHVDHGLMNFDMYDYQEDMIDKFHNNRFVICKMPRQNAHARSRVPSSRVASGAHARTYASRDVSPRNRSAHAAHA